jgi:hypothetical protein
MLNHPMMRTILIFLVFLMSGQLLAQGITFTNCTDRVICLPPTSCSAASTTLSINATSSCGFDPSISYVLDIGSDGIPNGNGSGNSVTANLIAGPSRIIWRATDICGNIRSCTQNITVNDCTPPTILCTPGIVQSLGANCSATFTASSFLVSVSDNCTPTNQLQARVRRDNSGTGFPDSTSITFNSCNEGLNFVEVMVRDQSGLISECAVFVNLQDNQNQCTCIDESVLNLRGCARTSDNRKLNNYQIRCRVESLPPDTLTQPVFLRFKSTNFTDSCFNMPVDNLPLNVNVRAKVSGFRFDLPNAGFTTYDLLLISRHILGLEPFTTFYQSLAADINNSSTVTAFDIVEGRRVILGVLDTFPNKPSWQIIKPLANPNNMLAFNLVETTYVMDFQNIYDQVATPSVTFIGIKTGDINRSAQLTGDEADDRDLPILDLHAVDRPVRAGEDVEISLSLPAPELLSAWQMALRLHDDVAELTEVVGLPDASWNYAADGTIRMAWLESDHNNSPHDTGVEPQLVTLRLRARQNTTASAMIQPDAQVMAPEATLATTQRRQLALRWQLPDAAGITDVEILAPRPNPFTQQTAIGIWSAQAVPVELEVFDITGRLVARQQAAGQAGYQQLVLNTTDIPHTGMYVWRVRAGNTVQQGTILKH